MRLLDVVDLANMPGRMAELEADALAMLAARKAPALDEGHFVRHVGVRRIMGDRLAAGLRDDLARPVVLFHDNPAKGS
jgi:hypothetical protein